MRIEQFEERTLLAIAGPQLVAVIPNAGDTLEQGEVLNIAPRELLFRFNEGQTIDAASLGGIQTVRSGGDAVFGDGDDVAVAYGWAGIGDHPNEVIVRFAETLPDDLYHINILGSGPLALRNTDGDPFNGGVNKTLEFELDLGAQVVSIVPQPVDRDAGTQALIQARDTIVVYFNDDDLDPISAETPEFYQLIVTNDTVTTDDDVLVNLDPGDPNSVVYDAATDTAVLTYPSDLTTYGSGTFWLRIGTEYQPVQTAVLAPDVVDPGPLVAVSSTTIQTVPGSALTDGDTFTLTDGSATVVFEFEDNSVGDGVASGHVAVAFNPPDYPNSGDPGDTDFEVAAAIADAINLANQTQGLYMAAAATTAPAPAEVPGILVTPLSGLKTSEKGGLAQFTVTLTSQPAAGTDVTIGLSSSDTSEGTVSPFSLTFDAGNWNVSQVVTVTGVDDTASDGDVIYTVITDPAVSADPDYSGMNANDVSIKNIDDEAQKIIVSPVSGLVTTEAGGVAQFTVVLATQPTNNVTIGLWSTNVNEGTVFPDSLTFNSGNWDQPKVVTVTGQDDGLLDGDQVYQVRTDPASSLDLTYNGVNPPDVWVTNLDNDSFAGVRSLLDVGSFYSPPHEHLFTLGSYLTGPSDDAPLAIAIDYLTSHAADLGIAPADLGHYVVTDQYVSSHTGVTHIYLGQTFCGLEVVGADINVNVTADGEVINVGSSFVAGLGTRMGPLAFSPTLSASEAVGALAADFGLAADARPAVLSSVSDLAQTTVLAASGISLRDIPAELVFVPTSRGDVELAWNVLVETVDGQHMYDASVSAVDGDVVYWDDWVDSASYDVYALPVENPDDGARSLAVDPADATASPYGWHDTNGSAGAEYTVTQGNNVYAYADRNDDDSPDPGSSPDGTSSLVFDFALDLGQAPLNYRDAAVTNLFYWNNISHDIHYQYGFDEAAGNFQVNNYGKGGLGGDAVQAQAQDGADVGNLDNANFATPPDGSAPRMQMFEWDYTSPNRDGDLSSMIMVHEYGHGVSNRLTGGPSNVNALNALQSGAMGEGWSDWWGLTFTQKPGDGQWDAYPVGTYVIDMPAGIRRYPYSFDMSIDPLTYDDFNGGWPNNEVHNAGEIWCTVLWDLNWLLIDTYGYDPDLYNGTGGNNLAMQLVMDGLKLQPVNPSFLDGRDAILLADQVLTGGQNSSIIWTAFARRGMGFSADDGGSGNADTVVAAYDLPATSTGTVEFDAAQYEVGDAVTITVRDSDLAGAGPISAAVVSTGGDSETVTLTEVLTAPGVFTGSISSAPSPFASYNGVLEVAPGDVITAIYNDADDGTGSPAVVNDTADVVVLVDILNVDFSDPGGSPSLEGFTVDNTGAPVAGLWHLSTGRGTQPDHSSDDSMYFGTGEGPAGGGTYDVGWTAGRITSPVVDVSGVTAAWLSFNYFLETEGLAPWDAARVLVSANGGPWIEVASNVGSGLADPTTGWTAAAFDLTPYVGGTLQVRFDFDTLDEIANDYEGWYVDDVVIQVPSTSVPGGITVTPTSGLVTRESGGSALFTVVLDSAPTDDVTIDISSSDPSEGTVSTASLTFKPSDWDVPQTVTVTSVDDLLDDGDVLYAIVTGPAVSTDAMYGGMQVPDVWITNRDNDGLVSAVVLSLPGDAGSSFATSQLLGGFGQPSSPQEVVISSEIRTPAFSLQMPGTNDEPGHRDIPLGSERHISDNTLGTTYSFTTRYYNFQDDYGSLPSGQRPQNLITENQKDRAREIFALYGYYLGIEFVETASSGITVVTGDLRVAMPTVPTGPGGVAGVGGGNLAIMDAAENWGNSEYGGSWFTVAMHEIGHCLGLLHCYDLPPLTIMGSSEDPDNPAGAAEPVFPGDNDLVHAATMYPPAAKDLDLYRFDVAEAGWFTAETVAERLSTGASLLDSQLMLYRETLVGGVPVREVIARNDDYYSEDSYLGLHLEPGTYYVAVASTGMTDVDPTVADSGFGGTTEGRYELRLNLVADPASSLVDATGTAFDGDADGVPGGVFDFWFTVQDVDHTHFVDKAPSPGVGRQGLITNPFTTIQAALAAAQPGDVVRIVGNGGADGDLATLNDNLPYLVGFNNFGLPLADGARMEIPQGVTVMIDAGALFKMQKANIEVGSSAQGIDRSGGALQVLGTPVQSVYFRSFRNDAVGGDSDGPSSGAAPGDFGGLVFRADSDHEEEGLFLNWVNHADINNGGGKVIVNSVEEAYTPIHMVEARPTVSFNKITHSADAAISADPNSFDDSLGRIGPDIHGNQIVENTINGLFVRIRTEFGSPVEELEVAGRWDDTDIVHVVTENLLISGTPAGPFGSTARPDGRLAIDPGVVVKLEGSRIEAEMGAQLIAEGLPGYEVIFTSLKDDRYGAGGTFDTSNDAALTSPAPGQWGGLVFRPTSRGSLDHALVAHAGGTTPIDGGFDQFNAIEIHQADVRIANSTLVNNASGASSTNRNGLGYNAAATIFVRGAQPIILNNAIADNAGTAITINANAMQSRLIPDPGRETGPTGAFTEFADNHGPLVRLNRLDNNGTNGMEVRGGVLTTETTWDDTDIAHVLRSEITVLNHHTFSGLRLQSSTSAGLVVKLAGANAGFTADGRPLDIDDRIGGTVQIVGVPGRPVVLTSLADDTVPAGFDLDGRPQGDTNNDGDYTDPDDPLGATAAQPSAGDWRSVAFNRYANSRNVAIIQEMEPAYTATGDTNYTPMLAEFLGNLAPNEKSGDDDRRLGFEVHGFISPDDPGDVDVYSFYANGQTEVWLDIDRTGFALDTVVELVQVDGTVVARSDSNSSMSGLAQPMMKEAYLGGDFYTVDVARDAGMRVVLPGSASATGLYFVRVTSASGLTSGEYRLQIRLRQVDEFPGCTVRYADIRYAQNGIEVYGMPAHSPLISESGEAAGDNNSFGGAQQLGNLLVSDRNTISVGGDLSTRTDVDWYRFTIDYDAVQSIAGVNGGGKTWATIFDVDYADGLSRADTVLSVFDSAGNLILVSRDSQIDDDQPAPGQGADTDDLTRGSFGVLDPFIGTVQMPEGTNTQYYVAITSNYQLPTAMSATFDGGDNGVRVRLEPVNSVVRVAEDHIGFDGHSTGRIDLGSTTVTPQYTLFDIANGTQLSTHVVPYTFADVVLFVATGGSGGRLYTVNPFTGATVTNVGALGGSGYGYGDIAMRGDGSLYGETLGTNNANSGNFRLIDTGNAGQTNVGDDGLNTNPNVGGEWDALAFRRTGDGAFEAYAANNEDADDNNNSSDGLGLPRALYRINMSNGAAIDEDGGTAGMQPRGTLPVGATITGLAFASPSSSTLYGVDAGGGLWRTTNWGGSWTLVNPSVAGVGFTGLTLGPQNLDVLNSRDANGDGFPDESPDGNAPLASILFASATNGRVYAFDFNGNLVNVFDGNGDGLAETSSVSVTGNMTGLAFSSLDFNLWHVTERRTSDSGHGIDPTFDQSRTTDFPVGITSGESRSSNERQGGASFYFGLEEWENNPDSANAYFRYNGVNAQMGILSRNYHVDLASNSAIGSNYNLPGGAQGRLVTNSFSLAGYDYEDKPTLYFTYFLETQGASGTTANSNMRDSARVWISSNGGASWDLLATNNSAKSNWNTLNELPWFISASSAAANHPQQAVQELFDNTGVWRQARVDLGDWAGDSNLMLRFDFSTAGSMNSNAWVVGPWEDTTGNLGNPQRGQSNAYEGFYVDDVIIGFAERGEMVTGSPNLTSFFTVPQNPDFSAPTEVLVGPYQLEVRRGTEYAALLTDITPNIAVVRQFDTNDRLVRELNRLGDDNLPREQDQLHIRNNTISDVAGYGILVDAGLRAAGSNLAFPGSVRNLPTLNNERLIPGLTVMNNVIADVGQGGIFFSGDPNSGNVPVAAVPFGKIVNNTIYGGDSPTGVGIRVTENASPTILNNILANTATGISIDGTSGSTVVGANLFAANTANGTLGSNAIIVDPTVVPLFVDAAGGNFYLQRGEDLNANGILDAGEDENGNGLLDGNAAIDSSLNSLLDRYNFVAVKSPLGIPPAPILAPERDRYNQLRVDDPSQAPPPGLGSNIFKDRGAIERADFVGPTARLVDPEDNGALDYDPSNHDVVVVNQTLTQFIIQLLDTGGIGIDDSSVVAGAVTVYQTADMTPFGGSPATWPAPLVEGADYSFDYDSTNDAIRLVPAPGIWPDGFTYTIVLDNSVDGIQDRAGNELSLNRATGPFAGMTVFTVELTGLDYGDAPDPAYPSLSAHNGASHLVTGPYYLGSRPDWESDARQNATASGDSFDDGVSLITALVVDTTVDLVVNASADGGFLSAWIDFNGNGNWDDPGEQVFTDEPLAAGDNLLPVTIPDETVVGSGLEEFAFARFRFSSQTGLGYTGYASDGEVEDYLLRLVKFPEDYGDAPADDGAGVPWYPTLAAQGGASHFLDPAGPVLGAGVDAELDGQPDATATGDDLSGVADEDGIGMPGLLIAGAPLTIVVDVSSANGFLDAWIDFNRDGDWNDPDEQIFDGQAVSVGTNWLPFNVPSVITSGPSFARFRISSAGGLSFDGMAPDGEVEDYQVVLGHLPIPDAGGSYTIDEGEDLALDGSGSWDPDGDSLTYAWDLDNDGQFDDATGMNPVVPWATLASLGLASDGTSLTIVLQVDDGLGGVATDASTLVINNLPPAAAADGPYTINEGQDLVLDGSGSSDPGGDSLTYFWDLDNDGQFDDAVGVNPTVPWATLAGLGLPTNGTVLPIALQVDDGDGGSDVDTTTLKINNLAPTADTGGPYVINEGEDLILNGSGSDPGGDTLTYTWDLDNDGQFDDAAGASPTVSWATLAGLGLASNGTALPIALRVADGQGGVDTDASTLTINNLNPTAGAGGPYTINEGQGLALNGTGSDPGGDSLTYAWDLDNDGLFDDAVGANPTVPWATLAGLGLASNGTALPVALRVADGQGGFDTDTSTLTINNLDPTANARGPYTINEGQGLALNGAGSDPGGDSLAYAWDLDNDGLFDDAAGANPTVPWATLAGLGLATNGTALPIALKVVDGQGGEDTDATTLTINNLNPVVAADNASVIVNESQTAANTGTFSDAYDDVTITASIGSVTQAGTQSGTWDWSFDTIDGPDQSQTVTITATDSDGGVTTTTFDLTVNNLPPYVAADNPTVIVDEGQTATNSGTFSDLGDDLVAITASIGTVTPGGTQSGTWDWSFDTTDGLDQSQTVTITATDSDGAKSTTTFLLTVNNVTPAVAADNPAVTVDEGQTATNTGTFSDPGNDVVTITASIGTVTKVGTQSGTWSWSFATTDGPIQTQTVSVTATDSDGAANTTTFDLTVNNVPPTVDAGADQSADEGATVSFAGSFTDPGSGDTQTVVWDFGDGNGASGTLTPAHAYADDGVYTVRLTVTDDDGGWDDDTLTVTVNNVAPSVAADNPSVTVSEGQTAINTGTFFDPGDDVVTVTASIGTVTQVGTQSGTWSWSFDTIDGPDQSQTVTITATDSDSDETTTTFILTVNNAAPGVAADNPTVIVDEGQTATNSGTFSDVGDDMVAINASTFSTLTQAGTQSGTWNWSFDTTDGPAQSQPVTITATDSDGAVSTITFALTVNNVTPTAEAGGPYFTTEGSNVVLDASASTDPGNDISLYEWDLDNNGTYDVTGVTAVFNSTNDGAFTVRLRVTDHDGAWSIDTATVNVDNVGPTARAGGPYTTDEGNSVTLSGALSTDPGNDIALYEWDLDNDGQFDDATGTTVAFNRTDDADYSVSLRVTDDDGAWSIDTTTVHVKNVAPTAEAGGPYYTTEGAAIVLSAGLSTDPGNDIVLYQWDLDNDGTYEVTGMTAVFTSTNVGAFTVRLRVRDDDLAWGLDTATVNVANVAPTAEAGGPYFVQEGGFVTLDASASTDPGNDIVLYQWDLDGDGVFGETGAGALRGNETGVNPVFSAAGLSGPSSVAVTLRVKDASNAIRNDVATIWIIEPLGPVAFLEMNGLNPSAGDLWYSLETTRPGFLTIVSSAPSGTVTLYDDSLNPLTPGGDQRVDWQVGTWETYYFKLSGGGSSVDLRIANLVSQSGTAVTVYGTGGEDDFEFDATASRLVTINGIDYHFSDAEAHSVSFYGGGADDTAALTGNSQSETAELWPDHGTFSGADYTVTINSAETVVVHSGGGDDTARLHDSMGVDTFEAWPDVATLSGPGFAHIIDDFRYVYAYAEQGGIDQAFLHDSPTSADTLTAKPTYGTLTDGASFLQCAVGFEQLTATATAGAGFNDMAKLYDSSGADEFDAAPRQGKMKFNGSEDNFAEASGFRTVYGYATDAGTDQAYLEDSPTSNDTFIADPVYGRLYDNAMSFFEYAIGFEKLTATATAGAGFNDVAKLYDSSGADEFDAAPRQGKMKFNGSEDNFAEASGFRTVYGYATDTGLDHAYLEDSPTSKDTFIADPVYGRLYDDAMSFFEYAIGFEKLTATAGAGSVDVAKLYDSSGADVFEAAPRQGKMKFNGSEDNFAEASGFRTVYGYATDTGLDHAYLEDSPTSKDTYIADPVYGRLYDEARSFFEYAIGFEKLTATATAGAGSDDVAKLYDSYWPDVFEAAPRQAKMKFNGSESLFAEAVGFRTLYGYATDAGLDQAFLQDSPASTDTYIADAVYGRLYDEARSFFEYAIGFEQLSATATAGAGLADVAKLYDSSGADVFEATPQEGKMKFNGSEANFAGAAGFRYLYGYATSTGADRAFLNDSPTSADTFMARPTYGTLDDGASFYECAIGFEQLNATATAGTGLNDVAKLYDSSGADVFEATPQEGKMKFNGSEANFARAAGFRSLYGYSTEAGTDRALLQDSPTSKDNFVADPVYGKLYDDAKSFFEFAVGFEQLSATATAGAGFDDWATLSDSYAGDVLDAGPDSALFTYDGGNFVRANTFRYVEVLSRPNHDFPDMATLRGRSGSKDTFVGTPTEATLSGTGYSIRTTYFDSVTALGKVGDGDVARLTGAPDGYDMFEGNAADPYWGYAPSAKMYGLGFNNLAVYFDEVHADAGTGTYDQAYLWDSALDDILQASGDSAKLYRTATPYLFDVVGFEYIRAKSSVQGDNDTVNESTHSFALDLQGWWEN